MPPHTLVALVFDFDGTLAETERGGHRVAYNRAFADIGRPWHWDARTYGRLLRIAGGKERLEAFVSSQDPALSRAQRTKLIERIHEVKQRHFAALAAALELRPGVERLVREARATGIRLAIATTAAAAGVGALLARHAALASAFEVIAAGDVVPHKKPAPDIYRYALDRLECKPGDCLAVEDSEIGLRAARAAGLATLVTPSAYTEAEDFRGAAAVLSDLGEPAAPVRVLAGRAPPRGFVDVAFARELVASDARDP